MLKQIYLLEAKKFTNSCHKLEKMLMPMSCLVFGFDWALCLFIFPFGIVYKFEKPRGSLGKDIKE
jgi:hypothetical protein